jgi:hypothetical protein
VQPTAEHDEPIAVPSVTVALAAVALTASALLARMERIAPRIKHLPVTSRVSSR